MGLSSCTRLTAPHADLPTGYKQEQLPLPAVLVPHHVLRYLRSKCRLGELYCKSRGQQTSKHRTGWEAEGTWEVSVFCGVCVLESGVSPLLLPSVVVVSGSVPAGRVGPVRGPDILSGISGAGEGLGFSSSPACPDRSSIAAIDIYVTGMAPIPASQAGEAPDCRLDSIE